MTALPVEALGRPVAVVVTTEFLHEANMQRDALGMPESRAGGDRTPLSTLSDAEIGARAAQAVVQSVAILAGTVDLEGWRSIYVEVDIGSRR